ncbi:MAG: hypothetical protein ACJARN_001041, partial [Arenicella sp.]
MNLSSCNNISNFKKSCLITLVTLFFASLACAQASQSGVGRDQLLTESQVQEAPEQEKLEAKLPQNRAEALKQLGQSTGLKGKALTRHIALMQEAPPYDDQKLQDYVTKVGNRL